jgi:hypothetical protein
MAEIALWAQDEHRLGRLPVRRRIWAPKGQRPTARVEWHYAWLYVYCFVRPNTGQSWWGLPPTVSTAAMSVALATFARDEGIDGDHRAVVVLDRAGWHTGRKLVLPEGIDVIFLPPASPELQPAERLCALLDEPVANRAFATLEHLEAVLIERCRTLEADPDRLKAYTCYQRVVGAIADTGG